MPPPKQQRIFFEVVGNVLRRTRGLDHLYTGFLPNLACGGWRMSNTAPHSDHALPAASGKTTYMRPEEQ